VPPGRPRAKDFEIECLSPWGVAACELAGLLPVIRVLLWRNLRVREPKRERLRWCGCWRRGSAMGGDPPKRAARVHFRREGLGGICGVFLGRRGTL